MNTLIESNKYGAVEVLDESDRHAVQVRFVDTGYETTVRRHNLYAGKAVDHPRKAARTAARKREESRRALSRAKKLRAATPKAPKTKAPPPPDVDVGTIHDTAKHGQVMVTAYHGRNSIEVIFFATLFRTTTRACTLRTGGHIPDPLASSVFGVGRRGIGPHAAHDLGVDTHKYRIWRAMLRRCYYTLPSGKRAHPSYEGVTVCDRWLDFQVFAEWYEQNYPSGAEPGDYQLDKDIRIEGNKVYHPEGCQFVTMEANLKERTFARQVSG